MSQLSITMRGIARSSTPLLIFIVLLSLISCNSNYQQADISPTIISATPTLSREAVAATFNAEKRDFDNRVSVHDTEIAVAALQTQTMITSNPSYVPATPIPTSTMVLGMFDCLSQGERAYFYLSCWRGVVNGEVITVAAGGDKVPKPLPPTGEPTGIPAQGVVLVSEGELLAVSTIPGLEVYHTPDTLGGVHIASADGTRLSIAPNQPNAQVTWVFDVATRQFYTLSGTPIPLTVTPLLLTTTPATP